MTERPDVPPLMGSWRNLYLFVLLSQGALIGLFYWFTRATA